MNLPLMDVEDLKHFIAACVEKCCAESRTAQLVVQQALAEAKKEHLTLLKDLRDCVMQHAGIINEHHKTIDLITVTVNAIGHDVRKGQEIISSLVEDFLNTSNTRFQELTGEMNNLRGKMTEIEVKALERAALHSAWEQEFLTGVDRKLEQFNLTDMVREIDEKLQHHQCSTAAYTQDMHAISTRLQSMEGKIAESDARRINWEVDVLRDIDRKLQQTGASDIAQEFENTISLKLHQIESKIQERDGRHIDWEMEILNEVDIKLQQSNIMELTQELSSIAEKLHHLESTILDKDAKHSDWEMELMNELDAKLQGCSKNVLLQETERMITSKINHLETRIWERESRHSKWESEIVHAVESKLQLRDQMILQEIESKLQRVLEAAPPPTPAPTTSHHSLTHNLQKSIMGLRSIIQVKDTEPRAADRRELSTESIPPPPPRSHVATPKRRASPRNKSA